MKIDLISGTLSGGGAERVLVLLANYFAKNTHTVRIITFNAGDAYELDSRISRVRLHAGKIKNHKIRSTKNLYSFYKLKSNRPNLMISFITQTSLIALLVAKLYRIKIVCSEHTNSLKFQTPVFLTYITRVLLYKFADQVTVLTAYDIDFYRKKGIKVRVLPNPCTFKPIEFPNQNRKKEILAVGNINRYKLKGFDSLIQLATPILKQNKDWVLKIVGGGEEGIKILKEQIRANQMEDQIILSGFRNDVNKLMQESDIFILTSMHEGLPMALLEAMSQGMACISYDCKTGPADIIEHGKNGLLIDDQNSEAMQEELSKLLNDTALRNKLRNHGVLSLNRFSMENIGRQWEQLFLELKLPE